MRVSQLAAIAIVASVFSACTKDNPNYCADANELHNCAAADAAAHDDRPQAVDSRLDAEAVDAPADVADTAPESKPPVCVTDDNCAAADAGTPACDTTSDAGARCVECTDNKHCKGDKPVCDKPHEKCVACNGVDPTIECKTGTLNVCDTTTMSCVECVGNANCSGTKPICDSQACRACKSDTECGGPGICLDTGACAADSQVLYVDFNVNGCPGGDGSSAKPFCNPSDAVAALAPNKLAIVLKGPASGQFNFDTAPPNPVTIVGRKNAGNEAPAIPLTVFTGVRVNAGSVTVRDLSIGGGTSSSARGALVSGAAGAVLKMQRVTIDTGSGLGIQADAGTSLALDQCVVKDNPLGGLFVNGASYAVENSAFVGNGYGVKFSSPKAPTLFVSNTVAGNTGNAVTCDAASSQNLIASIVIGFDDSCNVDGSVTTSTTFDASGYHLTAHLACPGGAPNTVPTYDIDGDSRSAPIDCGADEFK
ncbi:MAG TPA: right-handed parallel beta-helix repeat-containing protein [Acidimicrobiales bacterium]|nr:right-handed parallel beta-helix repeat-containing protein [Acidimicrobiales bacterium]